MKTIGCIVPDMDDPTAIYRASGPLSYLREKYDVRMLANSSPSTLRFMDVVFMQRPFTEDHSKIVDAAVAAKVPLWVDYDDQILDVPTWNHAYPAYSPEGIKKSIRNALTKATVVSVSTENLAAAYQGFNKNIVVIPNAYDKQTHGEPVVEPKPVVVWRGGPSHLRDVYEEKDAIIDAAKSDAGKKYRWVFIGANPWFITEHISAEYIPGGMAFNTYYKSLKKLSPMISIFPLADCPLNHCKSNCSWIETTVAGAVTVASDFKEFHKPGIIRGFGTELMVALEAGLKGDLVGYRQDSLNYIEDHLGIEKTNKLREKFLERIAI